MTRQAPEISVVVPAYDEPELLEMAADSVAGQESVELELIVVDDGSSRPLEPSLARARKQLGERLIFVKQANAGGSAARNRGVELAFLDHDDVWLPDKLARQLGAARRAPEAALVYCAFETFGEGVPARVRPVDAPSGDILDALIEHTWIRTLSVVMVRRDALGDEPWFQPRYRYANDVDLYYRIAERHPALFVDFVGVRKRLHPGQASHNTLESHDEYAEIVQRLAARLGPGADGRRAQRIRRRLARHRRGAAKAARARGEFPLSRERYHEAVRLEPWRPNAWLGWLIASLKARPPRP